MIWLPGDLESAVVDITDGHMFMTYDAGATWSRMRGYTFKWGHRVVVDPVNPKMIYITTYGGSVWHGPASPTER